MKEKRGTQMEIKQRLSASWENWKKFSGVLRDRRMPVKLKGRPMKQ